MLLYVSARISLDPAVFF